MSRKRSSGSRKKGKFLMLLVILLAAGIYYYIAIPAINIHASGFWGFSDCRCGIRTFALRRKKGSTLSR